MTWKPPSSRVRSRRWRRSIARRPTVTRRHAHAAGRLERAGAAGLHQRSAGQPGCGRRQHWRVDRGPQREHAPVNLRGWILADLGTDEHAIAADVVVAPGAYVVMGHNADRALNGGVTFAYVYSGVSLANTEDGCCCSRRIGRSRPRRLGRQPA
ncbi:MAG: hypothetical protein R3A10_04315 [Caldilineaceae bacterium]